MAARPVRLLVIAALAWLAAPLRPALAQRDREPARERRLGGVPREVSLEATRIFNAPATRRVRGDFVLAAGDTVKGDVAVLNGSARFGGVVTGQAIVLNGDVRLLEGARIEQSLTVLGGTLDGPDTPPVGGEIRVWSSRYRYHEEADTLVADNDLFARWSRWMRDDSVDTGSESQFSITSAHTYNRVEGLPIYAGPRFRTRSGDFRVAAELFGIFRTGDRLVWTRENLGHRARLEFRQGNRAGVAVGGRLFDEVDAMDRSQLTDAEVGLNTFVFSRDYRDFWQRHGGQAYLSLFGGWGSELRASMSNERWSSRNARDVYSLFNSDLPWRPNPAADEGLMHLWTVSGTIDTRTSSNNPRSGWYLRGEYEHGSGSLTSLGTLTNGVRSATPGDVQYGRAFADLRRYNRLGPGAQLNFRVVAGGWTDGDPLPVQRRLAVSGIDALPGFDFRRMIGTADVGTCATGSDVIYAALGRPAQCDRIALVQVEWKGDFRLNLFGDDTFGDRRWAIGGRADGTWVIFANSGRGWLVGAQDGTPDVNALRFTRNSLPPIDGWHTDLGGGFDFGDVGVYVAQAVSQAGLSPNVYVRLSRRF